ncbi:helix-turn-helix domain-containing protein [Leeuwenhoekiella palythoae]|uniref:Helix-turn-helix domain-containing protein n=1 Tax=Leeuwenhoekiella palythoae TaxID=573501 RepID=A0A1M5ZRI8_9FLAO|nr:AraC family transcriptional regulator [Leeuwenhoekiella palythoae]RXG26819.1 helix-turn-helix protein [Leeuwenhoekiella palythoae]SHI26917.1 Helix-turn-helix domain-containing protein [Leeuwenhoekiella palythoae]
MLHTHSYSLLNADYVQLNARWNYKNVISPYYRLYYIDDGAGEVSNLSKKLVLKPGYLYLIPSFTLCNLKCDTYLSQYFIQFFEETPDGISQFKDNRDLMELKASDTDVHLIKRLIKINPGRGINRSDNPKVYEKETYYKEYRDLNRNMRISVQFESQGIILLLLSRFLESTRFKQEELNKIPSTVLDAINYIQINLGSALTVADLSDYVNQNKDYFSRIFLEHTGSRPLAYIHKKRIERAQYLIVTTNKTLLDIAFETGFNTLPHFSKIFKKQVQITPAAYRKQNLQIT